MRLLLIASLALVASALHAQPRRVTPILGSDGKRVALVVGNDSYQTLTPLHNAANDASAMAAALRAANFQVQTVVNGTRERMDLAVDTFVRSLGKGDVALFYYSGHAMQINGDNYLAPVDLQAANEVLARNRSIKATEILEQMEASGADLQIMVLDACRDNPFGGQRSIGGKGLAPMNAGKGTFLAYATAPGRSADDNRNGGNGLYTTYLLQALREPGLTLEQVFKAAGGEVQRASSGAQIPWTSSSVDGDFYFHAPSAPAAAAVTGPAPQPASAGGEVRPSFNCAKATTPTEKLICKDSALAAREREMVNNYNAVLRRLPSAQRAAFRREHFDWFVQYARTCDGASSDDARKACITQFLTERTARLQTELR